MLSWRRSRGKAALEEKEENQESVASCHPSEESVSKRQERNAAVESTKMRTDY